MIHFYKFFTAPSKKGSSYSLYGIRENALREKKSLGTFFFQLRAAKHGPNTLRLIKHSLLDFSDKHGLYSNMGLTHLASLNSVLLTS